MPQNNDYLKSIDKRLSKIEEAVGVKWDKLDTRINALESLEDRRKGATRMLVVIGGGFVGLCGYIGSNLNSIIAWVRA